MAGGRLRGRGAGKLCNEDAKQEIGIRVIVVISLVPLIIQWVTGVDLSRPPILGAGAPAFTIDWLILLACGAAGFALGKASKIPGGIMIFSMLISAGVHLSGLTSAAPPGWLVVVVQIVIGCIAGARFGGVRWSEVGATLAWGLAWALMLLAAAALTAFAASKVLPIGFAGLLLALAPGGMVEMALITYALSIDVAFVVTCQVLRNFSTLLIAPALYRRTGP